MENELITQEGTPMIDKLKVYILTIGVQKYAPMAVMSALAVVGTFMAAHAGALEQYGVTYGTWPLIWPSGQTPTGPCILIELDTLSTATVAAAVAFVGVIIRATQHHTTGSSKTTEVAQ